MGIILPVLHHFLSPVRSPRIGGLEYYTTPTHCSCHNLFMRQIVHGELFTPENYSSQNQVLKQVWLFGYKDFVLRE